jgi:hypothetical protein
LKFKFYQTIQLQNEGKQINRTSEHQQTSDLLIAAAFLNSPTESNPPQPTATILSAGERKRSIEIK